MGGLGMKPVPPKRGRHPLPAWAMPCAERGRSREAPQGAPCQAEVFSDTGAGCGAGLNSAGILRLDLMLAETPPRAGCDLVAASQVAGSDVEALAS